jgi:hypothetical protein
MAWSIRKSARLPLGFRLNASKHGLGWSWGFRGFRTGKDSMGRKYRVVSIPGMGLYNRSYIGGGTQPRGKGLNLAVGQATGTGGVSVVRHRHWFLALVVLFVWAAVFRALGGL